MLKNQKDEKALARIQNQALANTYEYKINHLLPGQSIVVKDPQQFNSLAKHAYERDCIVVIEENAIVITQRDKKGTAIHNQ